MAGNLQEFNMLCILEDISLGLDERNLKGDCNMSQQWRQNRDTFYLRPGRNIISVLYELNVRVSYYPICHASGSKFTDNRSMINYVISGHCRTTLARMLSDDACRSGL